MTGPTALEAAVPVAHRPTARTCRSGAIACEDGEQGVGRDGDEDGRRCEHADADAQDPPVAVDVAEDAARQDQGHHRDEVRVDDPLLLGERGAEVVAQPGEDDRDDGEIHEDRARREHRRCEYSSIAAQRHPRTVAIAQPEPRWQVGHQKVTRPSSPCASDRIRLPQTGQARRARP
jgi:hypothetical protein